jgi:hypothetical protein
MGNDRMPCTSVDSIGGRTSILVINRSVSRHEDKIVRMFKGSWACWMMMSVSPCHQACKHGGISLPESLILISNLKREY